MTLSNQLSGMPFLAAQVKTLALGVQFMNASVEIVQFLSLLPNLDALSLTTQPPTCLMIGESIGSRLKRLSIWFKGNGTQHLTTELDSFTNLEVLWISATGIAMYEDAMERNSKTQFQKLHSLAIMLSGGAVLSLISGWE